MKSRLRVTNAALALVAGLLLTSIPRAGAVGELPRLDRVDSVSGAQPAAQPLVIGPATLWTTFLGGTGVDDVASVAVDVMGNTYLSGRSSASWGSPVRAFTGGTDAFAAKLDPSGVLLWHTFLGGSGTEAGADMAIDASGNLVITGRSGSTWSSPVRAYTASNDRFVAKVDANGVLIWNTFLGGTGSDLGGTIAVDSSGNVFAGGHGNATWGSPVRGFSASNDVFVAKLDAVGNLVWNTFLGGTGADSFPALAVDASGSPIVGARSSATWGSPVRAYAAGNDGFVAKLAATGALVWNTFVGGAGSDSVIGVAVDALGRTYLGGESDAAWGSPVRPYSASLDGFAALVDANGGFVWNTFLGGSSVDGCSGLVLAPGGSLYVGCTSFTTWGSPALPYKGDRDAVAVKLSPAGALLWHGFVGGTGSDAGLGIALDERGDLLLSGASNATWGSPVRAWTAGDDGFVARIADTRTLTVALAGSGGGGVNSAPAGLACPGTCAHAFDYGATVTLAATTAPMASFTGWSGDADCADGVVTMNTAVACTATFDNPASSPTGYTYQGLLRIVEPAPGIAGKYIVRDMEADGLNDNGEAIVAPEFGGTAIPVPPSADGDALYIHRSGQNVLLAHTGSNDPDGATYAPAGTLGPSDLNNSGDALFAFRLLPTPPGGGDSRLNAGLYRYAKGSGLVSTLAKTGTAKPGGGSFSGFQFGTSLNNAGDGVFHGVYETLDGTYSFDGKLYGSGIFKVDAANTLSPLVLPGDSAPVPAGSKFRNLRNAWLNDRGDVAFGGYTDADSGCTSLSCNELGLYVRWASGGSIQNIVRVGDVAPIAPVGLWRFDTFTFGARINHRGDVVFVGQVKHQVTGATGRSLFLWRSGSGLSAIAYPGLALPIGGATATVLQTSLVVQNYFLNDAGDVSFNVTYDADADGDGKTDSALFVWANGVYWRVARTGDVIPGVGAVAHLAFPNQLVPTFQSRNPTSRAVINGKGQVLFVATLTDGTAVLLIATPVAGYSCGTLAETVRCAAVADARTSGGSPTSNFGTSTYLRTRGTTPPLHNIYLKFDVRGLSGAVQSARLRLYAYDGGVNGGPVYSVPTTWTETGLKWNNQPPLAGSPLSTLGAVPVNSWAEYDVTSVIAAGLLGFGLTTPSSDSLYFHSREAYASQKPELVITLAP
jgi:hypothetical protein